MTETHYAPGIDEDVALDHVTAEEYDIILSELGRAPNLVELGIFSVMWSEHCSYKSSRLHLAKFPTSGERVVYGPGENAGVVDIGDNQVAVFKMESHNHPSFIEPYQGSATGVGGILRDVFTMGARPVALMNALRFGDPSHPKTRQLVSGVAAGIGGYGNCVGVPTVGGETNFDKGYNGNILVNAMAVGLADRDKIFTAAAREVGYPVLYVGAKTGRDGIHGATMASAEFGEGSEEKRPTVQVGDPFTEKKLIEACLELMSEDAISSIQDMGAAGLTSSSVEMASSGGVGIELDLDHVPQRETAMTAYEMMLSESQERMLMIIKPGREHVAERVFKKWDLDVATIGKTTDTGRLVLRHKGETVCDLPLDPIGEKAPKYDRPHFPAEARASIDASRLKAPADLGQTLKSLIGSPDMASKKWIWSQYDRHVMADTVTSSEDPADAAIVRVHGSNKALAITTDCTPRYCAADPFEGGKQAVAEAWRNLTAVGADPIAITDCLNFGNPERPEIMGQFVGCVEGMAAACGALSFPVVSGNVSLYNETDGKAIPPTPAVGAVGLIPDVSVRAGFGGMKEGQVLLCVGETQGQLGASLYLRHIEGDDDGAPPGVDLEVEKRNGDFVRGQIRSGRARIVHDISDGGLACAAAEMAIASGVGVKLAHEGQVELFAWAFGEDQARYLIAADGADAEAILKAAKSADIPAMAVGLVGGDQLTLNAQHAVSLSELKRAHEDWMPALMANAQDERAA
ncbi:phosphoribosylformylglycinamidine synthase subunit PurL [Marinicauda pacifica]|uniref:Phosphoribosylformylglycinamidine synthase subunit PurL n=1 Tax=Marinicauda pacifica TaxID=1133559 RepID=A0A4S2HE27_9PROT|nr:phosphoribosylformylglycinamidine synthase subunit PurL [Marinicauda pacifica]TGY93842.1 phosphoribosylformylglycinamidine synthase subunit PurL [Marinicauda pacifica]GGE30776.1 phosphoribosylformylglycinamidine synthase subunit PurL [Marinicauda pacifica]